MRIRPEKPVPNEGQVSRRDVLSYTAAMAVGLAVPTSVAANEPKHNRKSKPVGEQVAAIRRYMAASVVMQDGRVLVTGGYSQQGSGNVNPVPLGSAMILDLDTGQWTNTARLNVPRARHAAVALPDGRVAVLGGIGTGVTASVEIYDPSADHWMLGLSLLQPRYDHSAVAEGNTIYILGGCSQTLVSTVETYFVDLNQQTKHRRNP